MTDATSSNQPPADDNEAPSSITPNTRRYSSDEVADIIRLSLQDESTSKDGTIDYEELLSIGKEVGVDQEQIDRAAQLLEDEHHTKEKERLLWLRFKTHCISFVIVNVLCLSINIFTGTETFWAGYVLFGMGLFLLGHYAGLRFAPEFVEMAMERTRHQAFGYQQQPFQDTGSVSFSVSDPSGLIESKGLLYIDDEDLVIEYRTSDSVLGLLQSSIKSIEIKLGDIVHSGLENKFWSTELVLQGRNMKIFGNLPGNESGILRLAIERRSQQAALNLIRKLSTAGK